MNYINEHFKLKLDPAANPKAVVSGDKVRFTVLTSRIIRMEYSAVNHFEDRPSQVFWFRNQPVPAFEVIKDTDKIEIITEHLHLKYQYNNEGFTKKSLTVAVKESGKTWHYGFKDRQNLKGTVRTLDKANGAIELEDGLLSRNGFSIIDDSGSVVFNKDSWVERRFTKDDDAEAKDLYFFGYGNDYKSCLIDFNKLSGETPMFPRWVLGNWWSRYFPYTQEHLTSLMQEFKDQEVPLSVCIIDMDWHIVKNPYSSGWTGYTWDKKLIPDPEGLIKWLHDNGLKTAPNLHPADGVHPHEEMYEEMAKFMGIDPETKESIDFDITDPKFTKGYFEILHHPHENIGVDFWWMDWQQGTSTKIPGLDPLRWLNHLHFYDLGRDGENRPFIFSRYAGLGSHRYPIGFSGDTHTTWESLAFQPYFTSTSSNAAYGWWSHDIGGHMFGVEEPELYLRWVQYGVFSPIMRLHSAPNPYHERRPWAFDDITSKYAKEAMVLRHQMIPYLYSMLWRNYKESLSPIVPMYYEYPKNERAYNCPDQYFFGTELVAAPFIKPIDPEIGMARQTVWLPEGDWFNFFTGEHFDGGSVYAIYGDKGDIPVFAKAGAIVPLLPKMKWGGLENPEELNIAIFPGKSNSFALYEDDNETVAYQNGKYCITNLIQTYEDNKLTFRIDPVDGDSSLIPAARKFNLQFNGVINPENIEVLINGKKQTSVFNYNEGSSSLVLEGISLKACDKLEVVLSTEQDSLISKADRTLSNLVKMLKVCKILTAARWAIQNNADVIKKNPSWLHNNSKNMTDTQLKAVLEILLRKDITLVF